MLSPEKQLAIAIKIASETHVDQFDKGGKPYILHPIHLMQQLLFDLELAAIAVLHDVIEDSQGVVDAEYLRRQGLSERVIVAVELLTHKKGQSYLTSYIPSICENYDAVRVKRKDLEHNSNITRLKGVREKDLRRIEKYHKAFSLLSEAKQKFIME